MSRKPKAPWCQTGWAASARGGEIIEYTVHLPCSAYARVRRAKVGAPWGVWINEDKEPGNYKTAILASEAARKLIISALKAGIRLMGAG